MRVRLLGVLHVDVVKNNTWRRIVFLAGNHNPPVLSLWGQAAQPHQLLYDEVALGFEEGKGEDLRESLRQTTKRQGQRSPSVFSALHGRLRTRQR